MKLPGAGIKWERLAESFLKRKGLKLLKTNYNCRLGEIDLIMTHGDTIAFIEVRYRRGKGHGSGAESVNHHKQLRLSRAAGYFLVHNPAFAARPCRFDVVSISGAGRNPSIEWINNAFESKI